MSPILIVCVHDAPPPLLHAFESLRANSYYAYFLVEQVRKGKSPLALPD